MRRKIILTIMLLGTLLIVGAYQYWESLISNALIATLHSDYGLTLESRDIDLSLIPGGVSVRGLRLFDEAKPAKPLVEANRITAGLHLRNVMLGVISLSSLSADAITLNIEQAEDGSLQVLDVVERFVPSHTSSKIADPSTPSVVSATSSKQQSQDQPSQPKPAKLVDISLKSAQFKYHGNQENTHDDHTIKLEHLNYNNSHDLLQVFNGSAKRALDDSAILSVKQLDIKNLIRKDHGLEIEIDGVELFGRETEPNQFDFSELGYLWGNIIKDVYEVIQPNRSTHANKKQIEQIVLTNLKAQIHHADADPSSTNHTTMTAESITLTKQLDRVVLRHVEIIESNQHAMTLERLVLAGLTQSATQALVEIEGVNMDVREDADGHFNVARVTELIRSVIVSLLPKDTRIAYSKILRTERGHLTLADTAVALHLHDREPQLIILKEGDVDFENTQIQLNQASVYKSRDGNIPYLTIYQFQVDADLNSETPSIRSIVVDGLNAKINRRGKSLDIIDSASDWIDGFKRLKQDMTIDEEDLFVLPIQQFDLNRGRFVLTDVDKSPPFAQVIEALDVHWESIQFGGDYGDVQGPMNLQLVASSPTDCVFTFVGKGAPYRNSINCEGQVSLSVGDIVAYQHLYQESLPVEITQSGLRIYGDVKVDHDYLTSRFDMALDQPEFVQLDTKWPGDIDSQAAMNALIGLKNKEGSIIFRDSTLEGDVSDPNFRLGMSLSQVLTANVFAGVSTFLQTSVTAAKLGVDTVKTGAGVIGDAVNTILGGIKDTIKQQD